MKKVISLLAVLTLVLFMSGCGESNEIYPTQEELNQTIIIVKSRVDYYTFERGYYYAYKFTVEDTTNIFKHNNSTWFYSNEKWEKDDVVIVTEDDDELYFLNIGNLNYTKRE